MKRILLLIGFTAAITVSHVAIVSTETALDAAESSFGRQTAARKTMKITIKTGEKTIKATLENNAASRDFVALLPLTLTLRDYNRTEKISDLPKKLSTEGAPPGTDPSVGDIAYYAPWGNLAIFYRDFDYSKGLMLLGKIEGGVDALSGAEPLKATIEVESPR